MRSRSTLHLVGVGFFRAYRSPLSRRLTFERLRNRSDMLGSVPTVTTGKIDQASLNKVTQVPGHIFRPQIKTGFRQRVWQTSIGIARDRDVSLLRKLLKERIHQIGTERAIEAHR